MRRQPRTSLMALHLSFRQERTLTLAVLLILGLLLLLWGATTTEHAWKRTSSYLARVNAAYREGGGRHSAGQAGRQPSPRLLCWVLTMADNLYTKAAAVNRTWGRRCDRLLFISPQNSSTLPTVTLNVSEGRQHLFAKSMAALKYCYANFIRDYDWFFKADDDTYVIVENARHFLSQYDPSESLMAGFRFGRPLKPTLQDNSFFSGGAGYVLSRGALEALGLALKKENVSRSCLEGEAEDVGVAWCMRKVGVTLLNTWDSRDEERFHPFSLRDHLSGHLPKWLNSMAVLPPKSGPNCCSNTTISFHYMTPQEMYELDFLLYKVKVIGK